MRSLLLAGFVAPIALAACGGAPSAPADEAVESVQAVAVSEAAAEPTGQGMELVLLERVEGQHIADIELGTSSELLQELLGTPESIGTDGVIMEATGTTFETWHYPALGLNVVLERAGESGAWVAWVSAFAPFAGVMPCGLYVGMSEADARLVLGDELRVMDVDAWQVVRAVVENGQVIELVHTQMGE
jgi:hypothetical protein